MTVLLVVVVTAALWLALWAEDRAWSRSHPRHTEPPSRLDVLDGANPPADLSDQSPSPKGRSSSRSAGAITDDPWRP